MKALVIAAGLVACSARRDSLDDNFEHAKKFTIGMSSRRQVEKTRVTVDSLLIGVPGDCRCTGRLELEASSDGKKLMAVRYSVQHCLEAPASEAYRNVIAWYEADELSRILALPPNGKRDPSVQRMTGTYVHGDATMSLEWTREAYQNGSGGIEPNGRVSYFLVIKPRKEGDRETVKIENEPTVTPRKTCPLD